MQFKYKSMKEKPEIKNALSIDFEDWFHGMLQVNYTEWGKYESRLRKNLDFILNLLKTSNTKATFFILSHIAEKFPQMVEEIARDGHEVASHGYHHRPIFEQTPQEFKDDVSRSKDMIEGIIKDRIVGYRAPFFSVRKDTLWALDVLGEVGFEYDSSVFPTKNFLYGIPDAPLRPYRVNNGKMVEFPLSVVKILGRALPVSGGFYMRSLPYFVTKLGLRFYGHKGWPAVVYLHPWEVDVDKPKIPMLLPFKWRLIYEYNIAKMKKKFEALIGDFEFTTIKETLSTYEV